MLQSWLAGGDTTGWHTGVLLWLARATALCLAAAVAAGVAQRRSADLAHRVWVTALAGVFLLPPLGLVVPAWPLTIDAGRPGPEVRAASQAPALATTAVADGRDDLAAVTRPGRASPAAPSDDRPTTTVAAGAVAPASPPAAEPTADERGAVQVSWLGVVWLLWGLVAAVLALRLAGAAFGLVRLVRRSSPAGAALRAEVADVAASLGVRQRFDVRLLPAGTMPMACWPGRWVVLVPDDVGRWPAPLRWSVVAHELGHLARRDAWWDLLAQFACRVLWPHPLLWLAGRAVPRLRERACDEWVLATGRVGARDYAGHLLEVTRRCTAPAPAVAPAMARSADLERRLRSVFACRAPRPNRRRIGRLAAVAGCLALTAVLAGGQPPAARDTAGGAPQGTPAVRRISEPVPADGPAVRVAGVVVTPEGTPVAGAAVILRAKIGGHQYSMGLRHNRDVLARTETDAGGRFAFDGVVVPLRLEEVITGLLRGEGGVELLARADGRGTAWADVKHLTPAEPVRLALAPEPATAGVVRGLDGRGIPGVRVTASDATRATAEADSFFRQPGDLNLTLSETALGEATTDAEGRFTLHHLPPDYRVLLAFERAGWGRKAVFIDTGGHKELSELRTSGGGGGVIPVLHSPVTVALEPQRFARVRVVDPAGRPVGGGAVDVIDGERHFAGWESVDERGEAAVAVKASGRYEFRYGADPLQPRLVTSVTAELPAEGDPPAVEIRLPESRWLTGRVVDADTGRGVVGAYLTYGRTKGPADESLAYAQGVSGRDGEFRLPVALGPGRVGFLWPVFGYFAPTFANSPGRAAEPRGVTIDVPPAGDPKPVTLTIGRGLAVRGVVLGPDGKPVAGAAVRAQNADRPFGRAAATTDADGRFQLSGLSPHVGTLLTVSSDAGAYRTTISGAADHPPDRTRWHDLEVRLRPGVALTGRAVHQGRPRAGVVLKLFVNRGGEGNRFFVSGESTTDAEGNFRVSGLEAGDRYYFEVTDPAGMADPDWAYQTGRMQTVPDGRAEVRLPDVRLATRGQTLRGVVVDPRGKPVAGVRVSARLGDGRPLSRPRTGPPPWTTTDEQGRFELRQLPDQPIELMTYRANPGGGIIHYPSIVRPAANQQDVRILFAPTLGEGVEDLDAPKRPDAAKP
jgi:beta-lactamase regulating signal transducer with metallopeptidase domain/protocatechuate 3,4-dioxygenase beta subunit